MQGKIGGMREINSRFVLSITFLKVWRSAGSLFFHYLAFIISRHSPIFSRSVLHLWLLLQWLHFIGWVGWRRLSFCLFSPLVGTETAKHKLVKNSNKDQSRSVEKILNLKHIPKENFILLSKMTVFIWNSVSFAVTFLKSESLTVFENYFKQLWFLFQFSIKIWCLKYSGNGPAFNNLAL